MKEEKKTILNSQLVSLSTEIVFLQSWTQIIVLWIAWRGVVHLKNRTQNIIYTEWLSMIFM